MEGRLSREERMRNLSFAINYYRRRMGLANELEVEPYQLLKFGLEDGN